ncbi:MAG: hypothetical protein JO180_08000 [Gemmatirosa sp.]|nr:hypothetical protein [Gemmatirosa sp.]
MSDDDPLREPPREPLRDRLDAGVAAGIISPAQRDALLALPAPAAEPAERGSIAIAYWIGATLVVAALAWFLADRWEALGPAGVLAVAVAYAALFAVATRKLAGDGFPLAAGVALSLTTATAPVAAWALLRLTGEWPAPPWPNALAYDTSFMVSRRLVVELSAVLAALVALRVVPAGRVRRTPLAAPLAVAAGVALAQTAELVVSAGIAPELLPYLRGWAAATAGAVLFGAAYVTDRRQAPPGDPRREDFAAWLYAAACVACEIGLVEAFDQAGRARHLLPLVALAQLAASVRLRRRTLLAAGMVNVAWYVGYLAFEVFRDVLSFPFLLATLGAVVLIAAALVQRRYPALVRATALRPGERPSLPGGLATAWLPTIVALAALAAAVPAARRRMETVEREERAARARAHAERQRADPAARP